MIIAFVVPETYSHVQHYAQACAAVCDFRAAFPEMELEFFYYLKSTDAERFFFIRSATARIKKPLFRRQAVSFAARLNFTILPDGEAYRLARKLDINSFG